MEECDQYDIVIYTLIIEAGFLFTKLYFDKVYGKFNGKLLDQKLLPDCCL
jgi:hypothetical protein